MENLNNLIWTDEDSINGASVEPRPMKEKCLVVFCKVGGPGIDTAGTNFACIGDAPLSSAAALCAPG